MISSNADENQSEYIQQLRARIAELEAECDDKVKLNDAGLLQLTHVNNRIAELEAAVDVKDARIAELDAEFTRLETFLEFIYEKGIIHHLAEDNKKANAEIERLKAEIAALEEDDPSHPKKLIDRIKRWWKFLGDPGIRYGSCPSTHGDDTG